jgi:CheY-like chemotaxis protein
MEKYFKILNIEDDEHSIVLLHSFLAMRVPEVKLKFAMNKADAERMRNEKWDLIVCDGDIRRWDNHFDDVKEWFDAPIIMLSARNRCDLEEFLQKGAVRAFQKIPREFYSLIDYVKNLLDQKATSA